MLSIKKTKFMHNACSVRLCMFDILGQSQTNQATLEARYIPLPESKLF